MGKMKTLLSYAVATMLSLLLYPSFAAADPLPDKLPDPTLGIEDAIKIAKELVQKQKVSVTDSYIDSTILKQNHNGDRRKVWIVTWLRNEYLNDIPIKGGQTYVHIYMDGTGKVSHGE